MLCRKNLGSDDDAAGSVPVYLNVYDLTPINGYAYWLGLGVYHSGIQDTVSSVTAGVGNAKYPYSGCWAHSSYNFFALNVLSFHGVEYAFGAHEYSTTGIFEGEPKHCEGFTFRKTILMGKTDLGPTEVRRVMEELAEEYKGNAYNLITKNCNHFCNDACIRLTGNPIPSWVNRLARIGFLCNCVLPANLNSTKVQHHKMADKPNEGEKKKLTSESNRLTPSNSSSSSSSSPSGVQVRGRSRSRRALPPSSPLILHSSSP